MRSKAGAALRIAAVLLAALALPAVAQQSTDDAGQTTQTRFVSLKSDRVNVRNGPGTDYPIAWVFERAGLPVEIIREFNDWRQIRDSEGAVGWVIQNLLSGRRTALVLPWETKSDPLTTVPIHAEPATDSTIVAVTEAGTLASVFGCAEGWCSIAIAGQRGHIEQVKLWGVYKDERIE